MELNCKVLGVVKWGAACYVGCGVSKQGAACPGEMRRGQVRNRLMFTAAPTSKSRPAHRLWTSPDGVPSTDQPDKTSTVRTSMSYRSTAL